MTLLEQHHLWKNGRDRALAEEARARLRDALARHLPGVTVWLYGSLARPGRFHAHSDVDLAVVGPLPEGITLELAQSLLSAAVGREVDICLLAHTRLRERVMAEGEKWIP